MSLRNCVLALAGVLSLAACGFEPIAAPTRPSVGDENAAIRLRNVSIEIDSKRFHYNLQRELGRGIEFDAASPVRLVGKTELVQQGLAIEQNDTVTRLNLTATTTYSLIGPQGDPIRTGTIRTITAVNATTELYATQVSRQEAEKRLAIETARRLISVLRVENAKPRSQL